jgi:threonine dehydrogenase-like Zn-dependent dehydrogenase
VKALCWQGKNKVQVERVDDPSILNPRDAIIRITRTAICAPTCTYMTVISLR